MSATDQEQTLVLEYDLFQLPTAQHKAGLAGLLLMIDSMRKRAMLDADIVDKLTSSTARFLFTRESLQAVFDDLYNAKSVEVESKQKWSGKRPKRIVDKAVRSPDGKEKTEKRYVYDAIQPEGAFLDALYPNRTWVSLWQRMLWETLRAQPRTRRVYEERAAGNPSSLVGKKEKGIWTSLSKAQQHVAKGKARTESFSGSLLVGAQDFNPERVGFQGAPRDNLLLHFWSIASLVFVPRTLAPDGTHEYHGYLLAIPEPSDLKAFVDDFAHLVRSLDEKVVGRTPPSAFIEVPEQGGLEYLYHLARHRLDRTDLVFSVVAVELYQLQKRGNSVRMLAAERVLPNRAVLTDYEQLRKQCRNPLYKAHRIRNLLLGAPWHAGFDAAFSQYPFEFFVLRSGETPQQLPFFGYDVSRKFADMRRDFTTSKGDQSVAEPLNEDDQLALRVHSMIREYVYQRTEEKSGKRYQDFKDNKDEKGRIRYPKEYREARAKVCSDAFLAIRGRREAHFVEYFTGTICSVPQYLGKEDYVGISRALMSDWERVKTLSLLALSSQSYLPHSDND